MCPVDFIDFNTGPGAGIVGPQGSVRVSRGALGLAQSVDGGVPQIIDAGSPTQAQASLAKLYALTGLDSIRSQNFVHNFDSLAGWTEENMTAAGANNAAIPRVVAEYDGNSFVRSNGTDSLLRGYVINLAGTFSNQNPRTAILDQVMPWGVACKFRMITDGGGYCLFGMSDPTSTGAAPKGVYAGFEHGTNSRFYQGYKTNAGGGVGVDNLPSTVQLDGAWHVGYVFADASGFYKFSIDGEAPVSLPNANPFSNLLGCVRIVLAGTQSDVSWCSAIWPVSG
jgi:hypothetical protein